MSDTVAKHSPFGRMLEPGTHFAAGGAHDVIIQERQEVTQLQLIARRNKAAQAAKSLARFLGRKNALATIEGAEGNDMFICATGPQEHWIFSEGLSASDAIVELDNIIGAYASLFDQSAGRCVIQLAGKNAVNVLAKGTSLDLHRELFPAQGAIHTVIDHIPVLVAQRTDPICYDVSLPRSYADSFITWLLQGAREYGYVITGGPSVGRV